MMLEIESIILKSFTLVVCKYERPNKGSSKIRQVILLFAKSVTGLRNYFVFTIHPLISFVLMIFEPYFQWIRVSSELWERFITCIRLSICFHMSYKHPLISTVFVFLCQHMLFFFQLYIRRHYSLPFYEET